MANKRVRTIWRNDDYNEWEKAMLNDGYCEDEVNYERYADDCELFLDDERDNLDVKVNGVIVAYADLGLWDGKHIGGRVIGSNVRDILSDGCDYVHWYCTQYNVECDASHHDGTNHYIYRVAPDMATAERLVRQIAYEGMTKELFMKKTKSLRKYVARTYGW